MGEDTSPPSSTVAQLRVSRPPMTHPMSGNVSPDRFLSHGPKRSISLRPLTGQVSNKQRNRVNLAARTDQRRLPELRDDRQQRFTADGFRPFLTLVTRAVSTRMSRRVQSWNRGISASHPRLRDPRTLTIRNIRSAVY